ncbi:MAG: hypothetical protein DDT19_02612 [Syntrophomonadaceae bacterium]|nr:hypothetical protein [Bacillota bacterium]
MESPEGTPQYEDVEHELMFLLSLHEWWKEEALQ